MILLFKSKNKQVKGGENVRLFILLLLGFTLFLSSCSLIDNFFKEDSGVELESSNNLEEKMKDSEKANEQSTEEVLEGESVSIDDSSSELVKIIQHALEANENGKSITIHGETKKEIKAQGTSFDSHAKIILNIVFDPFVYHYIHEVVSGFDEDGEWYGDEEAMYIATDDGNWIKMDNIGLDHSIKMMYDNKFLQQIIQSEELFDLSEDANHYIVTFIGSEDQYAENFQNFIPEEMPFLEVMGDIVEDLTSATTGDITIKFSKDSYLLVEMEHNTKTNIDLSGQPMELITKNVYHYSYNVVDSLEIPEEVISKAVEF